MNVTGLDGRKYVLKLSKAIILEDDGRARSSGHLRARKLLNEVFNFDNVYEEIFLPGAPSELYLDFFVSRIKLAVEICGKQHYEFVPFFHGNKIEFFKQKKRDLSKKEWCEKNGIRILSWRDSDSDGNWRESLSGIFKPTFESGESPLGSE